MKRDSKNPLKWIVVIGTFVVAIAIIWQLKFGDSLVYFYTPGEVVGKINEFRGKNIRIGALVKTGTIHLEEDGKVIRFTILDDKKNEIDVSYKGRKPDLFREEQGVVVEGRFADGSPLFQATSLLVKHSEAYQKPEDHRSIDKSLLEQSLFKE